MCKNESGRMYCEGTTWLTWLHPDAEPLGGHALHMSRSWPGCRCKITGGAGEEQPVNATGLWMAHEDKKVGSRGRPTWSDCMPTC